MTTTHGGAGRGQGRKPLARRVKGVRVWVPVKDEAEAERITSLSAQERRARLLGAEVTAMRTFRYEACDLARITSTDLRQEAEDAEARGYVVFPYRITIYDARGLRAEAETAEALHLPAEGRTGIAWGSDATWAYSAGPIERDIDMWLNDPDEWERRN